MRETASTRLSRLLSLVPWLQQHDGVSVTEAAAHFGVTPEELTQDLWLTVCCGLPGYGPDQLIDIQFWDEDATIHVIDPQTLDRPLRFSPGEAMSLLVGLRLLAQVPGQHDRAALASVTAKLEAAVDVAHGDTLVVTDAHLDHLALLQQALDSRAAVRIVYAGASRDEITERVVEPGQIINYSGRAYLLAWCRSAGAHRTFRLDRVRSVDILDESIGDGTKGLSDEPDSAVAPTVGTPVRLRVSPRSRWLLETMEARDIDELEDGTLHATILVAETDWLVRIVLGQGGGVEVLTPPEVRQRAADAARQAWEHVTREAPSSG